MRTLESLTIQNFKSIREQTLELGRLNVFIGGNGAGKSNLIGAFRFLQQVVDQNLAAYTQAQGGQETFLYFGRSRSKSMAFHLKFGEDGISNGYHLILQPTRDETFFVYEEAVSVEDWSEHRGSIQLTIANSTRESMLRDSSHKYAEPVKEDTAGFKIYHFEDTSDTAAVKLSSAVEDNRELRPQGENLAAFLYWLQEKRPRHFDLIQDAIRQVAPYFRSFKLAPRRHNEEQIRLEWREVGSDNYFSAHALSDGTLRFICLATLLLQPDLPSLILLDEPELGLHPAAISLLAGLLESASHKTQLIVATQSVTLINQFGPEVVWTVDREDGQSVFRRLAEADMEGWLDDYSLGELWEKNRLGARP